MHSDKANVKCIVLGSYAINKKRGKVDPGLIFYKSVNSSLFKSHGHHAQGVNMSQVYLWLKTGNNLI